jgi:hypothetical protein
MENGQNETQQTLPGKKELKKQLADKIETALPELKDMLGEKKFANRIKKAAKLLMEGLHKEDLVNKKKQQVKKVSTQKGSDKKAPVAKAVVKKTAGTKTEKAAPSKKAKAIKKAKEDKQ